MGAPATLPADFFTKQQAPETLPADFFTRQQAQQPAAAAPPAPGPGALSRFMSYVHETPASQMLEDAGKGVLEGAGHTIYGAGKLVDKLASVDPTYGSILPAKEPELLRPTNPGQAVGHGAEQLAEYFAPAGLIGKAGKGIEAGVEGLETAGKLSKWMAPAARVLGKAAVSGATDAGVAGLQGNSPTAAGGAGAAFGGGAAAVGEALPVARGAIAAAMRHFGNVDMERTPPRAWFPPGQVAEAARRERVPMTAAEITESPMLRQVQATGERGLAGSSDMQQHYADLEEALQHYANRQSDRLSPRSLTPDEAGLATQGALRRAFNQAHESATYEFGQIDRQVGRAIVPRTAAQQTAASIIEQYTPFYKEHPELLPRKSWTTLMEEATNPAPTTFGNRQKLRSDLLEMTREMPDELKDKARGWMQAMAGAVDADMMSAARGMPADLAGRFRAANGDWERIKTVFDDPQSPIWYAFRTQDAHQVLPRFLRAGGGGSPHALGQLLDLLNPAEQGVVKREFLRSVIDPRGSGLADWTGMGTRLRGYSSEYLDRMLSPDEAREVKMLGQMARARGFEINPSGTSSGLGAMEDVGALTGAPVMAATGHPAAAAGLLARVPGSKALAARLTLDPGAAARVLGTESTLPPIRPGRIARALSSPKPGMLAGYMRGRRDED